jgi:putative salt-induced outer membrane protein YdiY
MLNPGFGDLWAGSADVGLSFATGNSKSQAFTAGIRAARETTRDKITIYANAIQASNSTSGVSVTTARALWAGARYDYNVSPKLFVFGTADFEHDRLQLLDLRTVFGGGLGYRAIRNERTQLDLFAGAVYNREFYQGDIRRGSVEVTFGDELKHKLNSRMNLTQRLVVYPNVSDFGRFRLLLDASLVTAVNSWLGWHVTVADRFNSDPVFGAEKNDLLLSTGLRVNFGRKK